MSFRPTGATLFIEKAAAPTVNDDQNEGYLVGDFWIDETNDKSYICLDVTVGAAVWTEITGGGGYVHPNHSGEVTSLADGAQTIANKETLSATAPITLSNTPTVIAGAAPVIAIPAATNLVAGHATAAQITAIEAATDAQHTQGTDTMLGIQAEDLDLGGFRGVNAGDASDPLDLVNLITMLNTYGVVMNFWLMATSLLSDSLTISVTTGTQVISATAELTSANTFFKSTVANTPTPFVVKNGTLIPIHVQALVSDVSGYKEISLHAELWRVDSDGSGHPAQIGADSASTGPLDTDKTLYELHIHVATETVVAAGSRLWLRIFATVGAGTLNPTVTIYSGDVHDHISIAVSGSVLGRYLQLAGGTMSGAIAMGANKVTGLAAPAANGDAVRATTKITEVLLESATDLKHSQNTDTDLDATFEATFVKKLDTVNVLSDITSAGADIEDAVTKRHADTLDHTQGSDVALGAVGTKDPPINADKVLYRNSASSDAVVTSTWTQVKAFLKSYFDTLYHPITSYVKLSDIKAAATDGGTFQEGAWRIRTLVEEIDEDNINTPGGSNSFTLAAGTYDCLITCPAFMVDRNQARLYNNTGATTVLEGSTEVANSATANHSNSIIRGRFTIAAGQSLTVDHQCYATAENWGFGYASDFGESSVYAVAEFWKVA